MQRTKTCITASPLTLTYWREAARELTSIKTLVFAALIVALRVAVKFIRIPLAQGLNLTFDCYVNAVGATVFGPVVGMMTGAVSDTIGCILAPSGPYFFPFIFVEMGSSFIFGLFFWRRKITVPKVLAAKFTVNLVCNVMLTSIFIKWQYYLLGDESFYTYHVINGVRIAKNLILFPLEAMLIVLVITAILPILKRMKLVPAAQDSLNLRPRDVVLAVLVTLFSVALVLLYVFCLKEIVSGWGINLL